MKKAIAMTTFAAALLLGISGCTDAEMADFNEGMRQGGYEQSGGGLAPWALSTDCKNYLMTKFPDFPNAAFSVGRGYYRGAKVHVPVTFRWDEPRVDERGECIIKNGIVQRYKTLY